VPGEPKANIGRGDEYVLTVRLQQSKRKLAAIMFADLVGYTALAQKNEASALQVLDQYRKVIRSVFPKYGGTEIKTMGDGFLIEFSSAIEAARGAIEIQRTLAGYNSTQPPEKRILARIGIHVGDILQDGDDIVGDGVNIASRIEPMAEPGGICLSRQVYDQIQNKLDVQIQGLGLLNVRNVSTPLELYKIKLRTESVAPPAPGLSGKHRIAVLPLSNIGLDKKDEYFADGMTEQLISTLSKIAGLGVIARTSMMRYKDTRKSIAEVGMELGVGTVVEGSIRKSGNKLRITVQLIDARREEPIWSQEYDRDLQDVFAVQSDIAHRIADALRVEVMHVEKRGIDKKATENTEAYEVYLRGRYFWNKRTQEGLKKAIGLFKTALRNDHDFALAYTGVADAYASLALLELVRPSEVFPKARAAAEKALRIDQELAEAHTSLGLVRFQYERDWLGAEKEFRKAIELNSNYALAHHFYADYLKAMGRFDEALAEIARAQELDPLSLAINTGVGHVLYLSRQYDRAILQYRKALELDPNFVQAHLWFGRPYLQKGMYREAISELRKAVELSGGSTISLAVLGHADASAGDKEEAKKILATLAKRARRQYVPSYWIALIYTGLGDRSNAFLWLRRAYRERSSWLAWVKVEPRFDVLRSDKRFSSLLQKMGL
jgi:TolB-like protein/Tfp pilus assembly protein PilF